MAQAKSTINNNHTDLLALALTQLKTHAKALSVKSYDDTNQLNTNIKKFNELIEKLNGDIKESKELEAALNDINGSLQSTYTSPLGTLPEDKRKEKEEIEKNLNAIQSAMKLLDEKFRSTTQLTLQALEKLGQKWELIDKKTGAINLPDKIEQTQLKQQLEQQSGAKRSFDGRKPRLDKLNTSIGDAEKLALAELINTDGDLIIRDNMTREQRVAQARVAWVNGRGFELRQAIPSISTLLKSEGVHFSLSRGFQILASERALNTLSKIRKELGLNNKPYSLDDNVDIYKELLRKTPSNKLSKIKTLNDPDYTAKCRKALIELIGNEGIQHLFNSLKDNQQLIDLVNNLNDEEIAALSKESIEKKLDQLIYKNKDNKYEVKAAAKVFNAIDVSDMLVLYQNPKLGDEEAKKALLNQLKPERRRLLEIQNQISIEQTSLLKNLKDNKNPQAITEIFKQADDSKDHLLKTAVRVAMPKVADNPKLIEGVANTQKKRELLLTHACKHFTDEMLRFPLPSDKFLTWFNKGTKNKLKDKVAVDEVMEKFKDFLGKFISNFPDENAAHDELKTFLAKQDLRPEIAQAIEEKFQSAYPAKSILLQGPKPSNDTFEEVARYTLSPT